MTWSCHLLQAMRWNLFYIISGLFFIFSPCVVKSFFAPKKSLMKSANALRWLRRHELDESSSTASPSDSTNSVDRLTLMAFGVSLLQIMLHALNEKTNKEAQFEPTTTTLVPVEADQSDYVNNVVEMISNATKFTEKMTMNNHVCSQRAKCDMERKWRQLTSSVRSVVERSFRNTSYLDKPIWKLSIRPHKDVCALLYPECPISKYSSYLMSNYLTSAAKLG